MRLPIWLVLMGYLGLVPFLAGPALLSFAPEQAPTWLDKVWLQYIVLVAVFLAGTLWGFGIAGVSEGGSGLAVMLASGLMLLSWMATWLPLRASLYALMVIFALGLLTDLWRERTLGQFPGYFQLRSLLTVGAIAALLWRALLL